MLDLLERMNVLFDLVECNPPEMEICEMHPWNSSVVEDVDLILVKMN
jgi:hypothetical protein